MANTIDWSKVIGANPSMFNESSFIPGFDPTGMQYDPGTDQTGYGGGVNDFFKSWYQSLPNGNYNQFDATGKPLAMNFNDDGADKVAKYGLLAMGGIAAMNGAFAGMGAGGGAGAGAEGGMSAADMAYMAGDQAGTGWGLGEAGSAIGASGGAGNGIASLPELINYDFTLPAIDGTSGIGALPTGMTLADIGTFPASAAELAGYAGTAGTAGGVGGLLKKGGSALSDLVGGSGNLAGLIGGAIGAGTSGSTMKSKELNRLDPRLDSMVFGSGQNDPNSITGAAWNKYQANPTGITPLMQRGMDMKIGALTDPAYAQTYQNMRNAGNGLLSQGMAGNPFSNGQASLNQPTNIQDLIKKGRGLLGS